MGFSCHLSVASAEWNREKEQQMQAKSEANTRAKDANQHTECGKQFKKNKQTLFRLNDGACDGSRATKRLKTKSTKRHQFIFDSFFYFSRTTHNTKKETNRQQTKRDLQLNELWWLCMAILSQRNTHKHMKCAMNGSVCVCVCQCLCI